ncbi:MAG: Bacteriocin-protection protein [Phenylobacterium sp.]|nr:Bacteriocin-protection protein [Phenylobacterium sp.]
MPTEVFFATPADWRDWLAAAELSVGFWKAGTGESKASELTPEETARLRANAAARAPPGYRKIVVYWIASAKRPETRRRRLDQLIDVSAAGRRIDFMKPASQR